MSYFYVFFGLFSCDGFIVKVILRFFVLVYKGEFGKVLFKILCLGGLSKVFGLSGFIG